MNSSTSSLTTSNTSTIMNSQPTSSSSTSSSSSSSSSSYLSFPESSQSSAIKLRDDWEKWYPMEWVAWVAFGPPSGNPSDLWVTEAVSDGPKSIEPKKKPVGRVDQRRQEIDRKASTKVQADNNTLKSNQILLQQNEFAIAARQDDLVQIKMIIEYAETEEDKVRTCTCT